MQKIWRAQADMNLSWVLMLKDTFSHSSVQIDIIFLKHPFASFQRTPIIYWKMRGAVLIPNGIKTYSVSSIPLIVCILYDVCHLEFDMSNTNCTLKS